MDVLYSTKIPSKADVDAYIAEHELSVHPLLDKGYRSIGCAPCTVATGEDEDERAGRWAGRGKLECGLHTEMFRQKDITRIDLELRLDLPEES